MAIKITDSSISVAAINATGTQIAFSPNNHRVFIATCDPSKDCGGWTITHALEAAHSQPISGIAWHGETNKILTCAHDRTAFVWDFDAGSKRWIPTVVMLDAVMTKGCTDCAFSPSGERIIIASAHEAVAVGKYSKSLLWYTCKFCTPHAASVTTLAPHPTDDKVLVSGSTDSTVRFTCIDTGKPKTGEPIFGQELQRFNVGAWVHSVVFLPSGNSVVAALHSSQIVFFSGEAVGSWAKTFTLSTNGLPFRRLAALNDTAVVAAGFDFYPAKIEQKAANSWKIVSEGKQPKAAAVELSETEKARLRFQNEATLGQKDAVELPKTRHSNTISAVISLPASSKPYAFMTCAVDGRVECWKDADLIAPQ